MNPTQRALAAFAVAGSAISAVAQGVAPAPAPSSTPPPSTSGETPLAPTPGAAASMVTPAAASPTPGDNTAKASTLRASTDGTGADRGEPAVKYTVIEDEGARIDELRVRGQTQRITVTPKGGVRALNKPYEIVSPVGSQDLQEAPNGVRGAAGKRVWNVLKF